ncbi:hypothetical protein J3R74_000200 [Puniceicoccus vermicola]
MSESEEVNVVGHDGGLANMPVFLLHFLPGL